MDDDVYDGPATLHLGDRDNGDDGEDREDHAVRIRLTGHLDPIDGRYHWQGMVFAELPGDISGRSVQVSIGERSAAGRITERTPWGSYAIAGVGTPPFAPHTAVGY